jgi:RimJ/RimL family protein N-acetyltransferase
MEAATAAEVRGDGFSLHPMVADDFGLIVQASGTDIPDWTFIPRDADESSARAWISKGIAARESGRAIRFVIRVDGAPAGTVGAQHPYAHDRGIVETFYFVLPAFRRRGLASAGLRALHEWVKTATPELRRLQLHVIEGNPGSGRVAELAGYRREGLLVNQIPAVNGFGPRDAAVYGLAVSGSALASGGVLA